MWNMVISGRLRKKNRTAGCRTRLAIIAHQANSLRETSLWIKLAIRNKLPLPGRKEDEICAGILLLVVKWGGV
ncbi:hypothetical protein HY3_08060 [Hyphomonas pacifica]|uniref:Uncharacterized protein n=1 Tax=Hyphomonas pacifica TaxID=1280941 RepID=A0A062U145_9PROT|nr:hypothetical protein HY2_11265 [Hyphomonas pacifica]RAN35484.1 hypothetical protein HY3_08060 [Hyphomonas pacifica]RAN36861.1 hypothetical protein HY11_11505 [Hyphomonas pacifica]